MNIKKQLTAICFVIALIGGTVIFTKAQVATGGTFSLNQSVIAGGGGQNSTGGTFSLDGTIGQSSAGTLSSGSYIIFGGFWNSLANANGLITISGQITSGGNPLAGVVVSLSGSSSAMVITDSSGNYSFTNLTAGGTYTVAPALTNYSFSPANSLFTGAVSDQTANFTAAAQNCTYSINPTSASVASGGAAGTISVTTAAGCNWTAVSNNSWITVTSVSGTGAGTASYSVAANSGAARSGSITIAGQTFVITQSAAAYSISGMVAYGTTPTGDAVKFVPGVLLSAAGTSSASASTDMSGAYQINNLTSGGNYTVTPSKSGDVNSISSFDASLVSRKTANLTTLTANQLIAADVSNDGTISSFDASLIARTASGISNIGIAGQWKFAPASRNYQNLTANQTAQNYDAILMGEVSGNWTAPNSAPVQNPLTEAEQTEADRQEEQVYEETQKLYGANRKTDDSVINEDSAAEQSDARQTDKPRAVQAGISVSLPSNAAASKGTVVVIPITVGDTTNQGIFSYDFTVSFDPNVLTPASPAADNSNTLSSGFVITPNPQVPGRLTISGFGTQELTGQGTLLNLRFNVVGTAGTATGSTNLTFDAFMFNEGNPSSMTTNGRFTVLAPTAASVSIGGRVLTPQGRGLQNARVTMTAQDGGIRIAAASAFGYFHFTDVPAGETYVFTIQSKRYVYSPQTLFVGEDFDELIFSPGGQNPNGQKIK